MTLYGALYLMVSGIFGAVPVLGAWMANNSEPHYRRATTIALVFISASAVCVAAKYIIFYYLFPIFQGGILSSFSFPSKEGPKFKKTTTMCLIL